ncbi:MAG: ATP-binding protein [Thermodesulfobacteriota bacterium]|nr:ATP-binding protein [Thermodesulfobacteriota bacterium]
MKLPARLEYLERFIKFVSTFLRHRGLTQRRVGDIELATEEALVNIFEYAYPKGVGDVEVSCRQDSDTELVLEISDNGIPFDALSLPDPDLTPDISDRKIGGLGILLIQKMVDEVRYRRDGERNILTFIIHKT